jgi:cell division septation protein DedD
MARAKLKTILLVTAAALGLSACQSGSNPFASKDNSETAEGSAPSETSVRLVDRDVEAPQVFQVSDEALWDGRPSLGGVWVASPEAKDPERVILRNPTNGKFVIGALFRRERINPGPTLQISSDAAAALGILAGRPTKLNVTALRREEAKTETPDAARPILDANEAVQTTALGPVAAAGAALDKADAKPVAQPITKPAAAAKPAPKPQATAAAKPTSTSGKGLIQIGIFSVEANANRASSTLTKAGISASVTKDSSQGKDFWRVTAGPAPSNARDATLTKVKGLGFTDAYYLSR